MHLRRLLATSLTATLVATTATVLGGASPAVAATETRIVSGTDGKPWISRDDYPTQPGPIAYGGAIRLSIEVQDANGNQVYDGSIVLQRKDAGSKKWKTIANPGTTYVYDSIKARKNATYRVLYSGSGDYSASQDLARVKVQRDLNDRGVDGRKLFLAGKVAPKYARKPVTIQKKVGKKWRTYKSAKTNPKSRFKIQVAAPPRAGQKIRYRIVVKKGGGFTASRSQVYIATKRAYRGAF